MMINMEVLRGKRGQKIHLNGGKNNEIRCKSVGAHKSLS